MKKRVLIFLVAAFFVGSGYGMKKFVTYHRNNVCRIVLSSQKSDGCEYLKKVDFEVEGQNEDGHVKKLIRHIETNNIGFINNNFERMFFLDENLISKNINFNLKIFCDNGEVLSYSYENGKLLFN